MDLLSLFGAASADQHAAVIMDAARCLHSLNKNAVCDACVRVCPTQAILPGEPPELAISDCVGCFACLPVCPTGAFSGGDSLKSLLSAAERALTRHKVTAIDLVCARHPEPASGPPESQLGLRLRGCLGQIGVGGYLALLALGVEKISVRLEHCQDCPVAELHFTIVAQVQHALALLGADAIFLRQSAGAPDLQARPGWNADSPPISRAELLRMATAAAPSARHESLIAPDDNHLRAQNLSPDRFRRGAALAVLHDKPGAPDNMAWLDEYAQITVDDRCTGCSVCAQACPTGALERLTVEQREYRLVFDPQRCVACQVCARMCPEDALVLEQPAAVGYVLAGDRLLHSGPLVNCQRCSTLFSPKAGEVLCPPCRYRRENPFGSRLPRDGIRG